MAARLYRLLAPSGQTIAPRVALAAGPLQRLLGLVGRGSPPVGTGLWLNPCNGIHTFGMRFPLDVIALDKDSKVVFLARNVRPCRVLMCRARWHSTVELAAGALDGQRLGPGDRLRLVPAADEDSGGAPANEPAAV